MPTRATKNRAATADEEHYAVRKSAAKPTKRQRGRWWAPRDWRVRPRLIALIVIPTAVAVLLGGLRIYSGVSNTFTHERIEAMAELGESVVNLGNELGKERLLSASYIADSADPTKRSAKRKKALDEQVDKTQQAQTQLQNFRDSLGDPGSELIDSRLESMMSSIKELDTIRNEITGTRITLLPAVTKYRQIITSMNAFNETIAENTDDTPLRESVRALTALGNAREQLSYESALMLNALQRNRMSTGVKAAVDNTRARFDNERQNFIASASTAQREDFDANYTGPEVSQARAIQLRTMIRVEANEGLIGGDNEVSAGAYEKSAGVALARFQKVESGLAKSVKDQASALRTKALNSALLDSLLVLFVLLAVFFATTTVIRSLLRPLRSLREGAIRIAQTDLPEAIARMQDSSASPGDIQVKPVKVTSKDEIAEVARSFDEVHRVALMLASDEAALRSNVNAMFVNLSRRSQTLVERQLRLIDGLEQSEQDGDRLSDLFSLDHLATRMRRNNENLLVLSGQDNTRKWAQPVPLVDVLRGAISEVEQYERVNVRAPSHISVLGRPVNDVIHLVAELVENATSFSSQDTQVSVTARQVEHGAVQVEVSDSGIGMPTEELEVINERLAEPPVIDLAVSRRMGLFVVSRLAARHGIRVRLSEAHNGGITAFALFPADLLITAGDAAPPALGAGPAGVPDTYAEATAAFAASPAPADPAESWQIESGPERSVWHSDQPSLPKRGQPAAPQEPAHSGSAPIPEEHPPSGQDLWADAGWNPQPADSPPREPRRTEPPARWDDRRPPARPAQQEPPAAPRRPAERQPYSTAPSEPAEQREPVRDTSAWAPAPWQPPREQPPAPPQAPPAAPYTPSQPASRPERRPAPAAESDSREGYGSTAYLSKRYGAAGGAGQHTVVPPSPENASDSLPIFDSIESNWFRRRSGRPAVSPAVASAAAAPTDETGPLTVLPPSSAAGGPANGVPRSNGTPSGQESEQRVERPRENAAAVPEAAPQQHREDEWRSESDRGWKAARTVADPIAGGLTSSGLPKRVPKANLVPGTAPQPENFKQITSRSADHVRNRFSGFQKGVRQGRTELGEPSGEEN